MLSPQEAAPSEITFPQAIALTKSLLSRIEAGELSPGEIEAAIAELVKTEDGARGFFVTYLTSDLTLADNPAPEVVRALQSSPEIVAELLVKNLAMSATMAFTHRRNGNEDIAQGSDRVRERTARLIELVDLPVVREVAQNLLENAATGEGRYKVFLQQRGYDAEQRQVMCKALQEVIPEKQ